MRLTQKLKSAIKLLKEVETDGEKCEGNYIHFNKSKYFVFKNNLYKSQKYNKPIGTIKNGRIVLKGSMDILKSAQHGIRLKSKSLKLKNSKPSFEKTEVFESSNSNTFESPFEKKNSMNEPSETESFESPFEKKNSVNEPSETESFESPFEKKNSVTESSESPKKNVNSNESEKEVFESPFEKTETESEGSEVEDSKKLPESSEEI